MRIEEMRGAAKLLRQRVEMQSVQPQQERGCEHVQSEVLTLHPDNEVASDPSCDLSAPTWSVVSFKGTEAGGLGYKQAVRLMAELEKVGVVGLCIVTDTAARRIA